MKILFYLHHPSQFHLFKSSISELKKKHKVLVVATKKNILLDLLDNSGIEYVNILPEGRKNCNIILLLMGSKICSDNANNSKQNFTDIN